MQPMSSMGGPGYIGHIPTGPDVSDWLGFFLQTEMGLTGTSGFAIVRKVCHSNTSQGTFGELWNAGPKEMVREPSGEYLLVRSTSASDTFGDTTGANNVRIYGLDDAFQPIIEDIALSGTTAVRTVNKFRRVNGARVVNCIGPSGAVGSISGICEPHSEFQFYIPPTSDLHNITSQSQFTVPSGWTAYILGCYFTSANLAASKTLNIAFERKEYPSGVWTNLMHFQIDANQHPIIAFQFTPIPIQEMSDIRVYFETTDSSIMFMGAYSMLLVHRGMSGPLTMPRFT